MDIGFIYFLIGIVAVVASILASRVLKKITKELEDERRAKLAH